MIRAMRSSGVPLYFADEAPRYLLNGDTIADGGSVSLTIGDDMEKLAAQINSLKLPSRVTPLEGAYLSVIPGEGDDHFVTIVPVIPGSEIGGEIMCTGQRIDVEKTRSLSIYRVGPDTWKRVL